MNYYYDILLNFEDNYIMFYEWDSSDSFEFIKKIPMLRVDNKTYKDLLINKVLVNKEFLNIINNKTKLKKGILKYACIISDSKNSIALEFNDDGLVISKSSILLDDELNINEFIYDVDITKIDYKKIKKEEKRIDTRKDEKIKRILKIEIDNMYNNKNYSKLKYIYLEWFNTLDDNYDLMYKNMLKRLKNKLSRKEYDIYKIIKLTYSV